MKAFAVVNQSTNQLESTRAPHPTCPPKTYELRGDEPVPGGEHDIIPWGRQQQTPILNGPAPTSHRLIAISNFKAKTNLLLK